jgi:hypothetical protein
VSHKSARENAVRNSTNLSRVLYGLKDESAVDLKAEAEEDVKQDYADTEPDDVTIKKSIPSTTSSMTLT